MCVCTEDDWETSHLAEVGGEGNSLPTETLHHDDAILGAVPIPTADPSHTPQSSTADDEVNSLNRTPFPSPSTTLACISTSEMRTPH